MLALAFFALGLVSERTRFPPFHSAAIWLPSGLALAALVRARRRDWGPFLGALFVAETAKEWVAGGPLLLALTWAVANCLRAGLAAALLRAWVGGPMRLDRLREVVGLVVIGGLFTPLLSATLGAAATVHWRPGGPSFLEEWVVWWLADSLGCLLMAPLLLCWWPSPLPLAGPQAPARWGLLLGALGAMGYAVFNQEPQWSLLPSFTYLPFPLLAWAALWLGPAGATAAMAVLGALVLGYSAGGRGPFGAFVPSEPGARLLAAQAYLAVMGTSASALAAMVAERRWAARAQQLLGRCGVLLAESTEDGRTFSCIGPQVVPALATGFAAWEVREDGQLALVARTGLRPTLLALLTEQVTASAGNPVEATAQAILVPLRSRSQWLGALALVSEEPLRPLGARERVFAEELGLRCALALDNHRLLARTRQAVHAREEFIGIAAHELRTPLTSLKLQLQTVVRLLHGLPATAPALQRLYGMDRQASRLSRLVGSLLDVGRLRATGLQLEREEVQLDAVVREVTEGLREDFTRAGSRVVLRLEEGVRGAWDRLRLEQVLTNLLANALKFGAGRPIEVEVSQAGDTACLTVRDHGMGMESQALARIFEPFAQAVSAREYGGLGLGLYLTREIVEAHSGRVHAASRPGEGATFTVELPALPRVSAWRGPPEASPRLH